MSSPAEVATGETLLRRPVVSEGGRVHALVEACPPLDVNTPYAYLLMCRHFAETSVVAEQDGELTAFLFGYVEPEQPDAYFVWQIAVGEKGRGQGLGARMIDEALSRPRCDGVRFVEATITDDNKASWGLFRKYAARHEAPLHQEQDFFQRAYFEPADHNPESLVRIGPLKPQTKRTAS